MDEFDQAIIESVLGQHQTGSSLGPLRAVRRHKFAVRAALAGLSLPSLGETFHVWSTADLGDWLAWLLPQTAAVDCLWVCSASFSRQRLKRILPLLRQCAGFPLYLLAHIRFARQRAALWEWAETELDRISGLTAPIPVSFNGLLLVDTQKDLSLTLLTPVGLRRCPAPVHTVVINDPDVFNHLQRWLLDLMDRCSLPPEQSTRTRPEGYFVRRAGLAVVACSADHRDQAQLLACKLHPPFDRNIVAHWADRLAALIRHWLPVLPEGALVATPPQGASWPGPYFAGDLAKAVAERLNLPHVPHAIVRTDDKAYHAPVEALRQAPFRYVGPRAAAVIVVDDLITSAATMTRAIQAVQQKGIPVYGFACYRA